ncbi:MAG: GDP-mannose 4,6-dehydratase [Methanoregula sp.]|nr:GDP-mannose 4,6-dehydratase [Methanoregula sp.]
MPIAIIVGATGQDGTFLYNLLEGKKYSILGIGRRSIITNIKDWDGSKTFDICNFEEVAHIVQVLQPDEIYHLAAIHHSSQDPVAEPVNLLHQSYDVNVVSLFNFLEAIRRFSPNTKIFYAASSHIFGKPIDEPQDENTVINPVSVYGITKASGLHLCRMYRSVHHVFASVGILYNHESWLRGEQFVSQKIVKGAINCKKNPLNRVILGDLSVEVDWGFALDYVDAMHRIVLHTEADDFIIATGEKHTVEEFVSIAFAALGLDWRGFVEERKEIITRTTVALVGNPAKLMRKTDWKRAITFSDMVKLLVKKTGEYDER